jgi:transcriptional regulator with XRE-family HTH domain
MKDQLLIQQILNKTGLSQSGLAKQIKVGRDKVNRWLKGSLGIQDKHKLSLYKLCIKKDVYNVDLLFKTVDSDYISYYREVLEKEQVIKFLRKDLDSVNEQLTELKRMAKC